MAQKIDYSDNHFSASMLPATLDFSRQDITNCPECNGDSLCRDECFARCPKCGIVIVAEHIEMPNIKSMSWANLKKIKECYGKNDNTTKSK